jgi:hypothetical protein
VPLLVGGLPGRILRWHVMHLDVGNSLFPVHECGAAAGILQVNFQVDVRLGASTAVALGAVCLHEGVHVLFEDSHGVGPQCRLIRTLNVGLRRTRQNQRQDQGTDQSCGLRRNNPHNAWWLHGTIQPQVVNEGNEKYGHMAKPRSPRGWIPRCLLNRSGSVTPHRIGFRNSGIQVAT